MSEPTSARDVELGVQSLIAWAILVIGGVGVYGIHAWAVHVDPPPPPPEPEVCREEAEVISHSDATRHCLGGGLMTMTPMSDGQLAVLCTCPALHLHDGGAP